MRGEFSCRLSGRAVRCLIGLVVVACPAVAIPPGMPEAERLSADEPESGSPSTANVAGGTGVTLMGQVTPQQFSTNSTCPATSTGICANDVWAYTSPSEREYGILGLKVGTGFVDISDPYSPQVVGAITDADSIWSDMKTYQHYAYNVNETSGGLQIIDLSQIDPPTRAVTLVGSFTQNSLSRSHTLAMNEASGFLYLCGSNLGGGRLVAVNLANPTAPQIAGQMIEPVYVHAAQVVTYTSGPYAGQEIAFCYAGSAGLKIVNVTNKANMFTMSTLTYPTLDYCHQGELTSDWRYVVIDDEGDETGGLVPTTTTYVANVEDLSNPFFVTSFTNGLPAIDHNQMVRGDFTYQANYTTGLRVWDISDVNNAQEVGSYDSYPQNNNRAFNGAWGVHARLCSGTVLISDMQSGLLMLDPSEAVGTSCTAPDAPQVSVSEVAKNRYLTVLPGSAGECTALRLTIVNLPPPFESMEGMQYWVDRPVALVDNTNPPTTYMISQLRCTPLYMDFGSVGTLQIADHAIVPGGSYTVEAVRTLCARSIAAHFSAPASIATGALWGDVAGSGSSEPDGAANALDVVGLVNKFKQLAGAVTLPQADLYPHRPDFVVNALDIVMTVNAFKGEPYPFPGPETCP